ncbi:MAG: flagellar basal body rod protein FlgC [Oscillospiraceae bacterium]|nr:flagellar basal body rod protein FlgC [Oscillospiraceae bacterium]
MAFLSNLDVAVSGMIAQRTRADVIAQNVANAETTRTAEGGPYIRQNVVFSENVSYENDRDSLIDFRSMVAERLNELKPLAGKPDRTVGEGVLLTEIVEDPTPPTPVYDPSHPDADEDGYYYLPNVDVAEEQIDMLAATQSYTANLTIFNSLKTLATKALTIGQ